MYNKENKSDHRAISGFPESPFCFYGQSFKKVAFTLIKTVTLNRNQQLTEEQSRQIEKATKREIVKLKIYCLRGGILFCFLILNIIHHHHR